LKHGVTIAEMSEEAQVGLNKTVTAAIDAYTSLGRQAPQGLLSIQHETQNLIDIQNDAKAALDEWSEAVRQHQEDYKRGEAETVAFLEQQEQERIDSAKAALDDYAEVVRRHQEEQKAGEAATLQALEDQRKHYQDTVKAVRELGGAIAELAQVSGGAFGSILSDVGGFIDSIFRATSAIDDFKGGLSAFKGGDTLSGIAGMASGILGIATAAITAGKAIANLLDRNKGRDLVTAFAGEHGGFDALHRELLALDKGGEQLWINLTQGVGRNNPEQARSAIEAIATALKEVTTPTSLTEKASAAGFHTIAELQEAAAEAERLFEFMRDSGQYSAEAVQAAWERANAALIASGDETAIAAQKAHDAIAALDSQIKSLTDSIANEAPEAEMGLVEARIRDEIKRLEAQQQAAAAAIDTSSGAAVEAGHKAADAFSQSWTDAAAAAEEILGKTGRHMLEQAALSTGEAANDGARLIQEVLSAHDFVARLRFEYELPEGISVAANVPALAGGGIVRRPTLALVGEAGPEAVVPLSRGSLGIQPAGGDVGQVVNNYYVSAIDAQDVQRFFDRREADEAIERKIKRPGNVQSAIRTVTS